MRLGEKIWVLRVQWFFIRKLWRSHYMQWSFPQFFSIWASSQKVIFFYLFIHLLGFLFVGILWWWVREFLLCFGIPSLFLSSWLIIIMMTIGKFDLLFWVSSIFCLMYVSLGFDLICNYIVDPPKILLWVTTLLCLITLGFYTVSTLERFLCSTSITLHVESCEYW